MAMNARSIIAGIAVCFMAVSGGAMAQPHDPRVVMDAALCNGTGPPPAEMIAACTRVIDSPRANDGFRAIALNNRAYEYLMLGKRAEAVRDLDRAIELEPGYSNAFSNRSRVYLEMRELDLAMVDIETSISAGKNEIADLPTRARILSAMGYHGNAMKDVNRALRQPQNAEALLARGEVHLATGKPEQALKDFLAAIKMNPEEYVRVSLQRAIREIETRQQMDRDREAARKREQEEAKKPEAAKKQTGRDDLPAVFRPENPWRDKN